MSSAASCVADSDVARKGTPARVWVFQVATRRLLLQPVPASCVARRLEKLHFSTSCGMPLASKLSSLALISPFHSLESNWLL